MNVYLTELADGIEEPCELKIPDKPPDWLDKDKFERGRNFFKQNPISVLMSNYRNLVIGLSVVNLCDALVLTQRSETKKKAFWRYIDTGYFMSRFLQGPPPWEQEQTYRLVNNYHNEAAKDLRKMNKAERRHAAMKKVQELNDSDKMPTNEELDVALLDSLEYYRTRVFASRPFSIYEKYMNSSVIFSHFDMAIVQIAFFASVVIFPKKFGAGFCSDESFDDFLHLWRVIGYYLGVKDEYNPVRSTLSETRKLLLEIGEEIVIPSIINLNMTSLHMAKCVTKAYNTDYHLLVYTHCYNHGYELRPLWKKFSLKQKLIYYWQKVFIEWIYCLPFLRFILNKLIFKALDRMHEKRSKNNDDKRHE